MPTAAKTMTPCQQSEAFRQHVRYRLTHGLPLTISEQQRLCEVAYGEAMPQRKRCDGCGGDGYKFHGGLMLDCPACSGTGYVLRDISQTVEV